MRKFIINVNGNSYEVEVEEVVSGSTVQRSAAPVAQAPVSKPVAKSTPAPAPKEEKKEVVVSAGQEVVEARQCLEISGR